MNLWTVTTFIFFTALVAVISWYMTRKEDLSTNKGYFLAGRSLKGGVIAGSLLLTNLSAEQLVGLNGNGFSGGLLAMHWEIISGITMVFMALIFLPRYLKSGYTTVPEFLEQRYDKQTRNIVTALFLISLTFVTLPIVLYAGGLAINSLFNVPEMLGVSNSTSLFIVIAATGIVGGIYAIFGGLKAVAVSDTINGVGLVIGGVMIPVLGLIKLGGGSFLAGLNQLIVNHPEKMNAVTGPGNPPFVTIFTGIILVNTFYWCTNQQIVQRTFAAVNLKEGQKGVLIGAFLKVAGSFILVIPGIIAYHLYGSEIGHQDLAYAYLVGRVLPTGLVGFFGAVVFGAVLSSFNSALNSASTMFCINIFKPIFNTSVSDEKLVKIGKIFGTVVCIFSIFVAPQIANAPTGLYDFMRSVMGFFNIPTLAVVLMGFATKYVPAIGAKIAIAFFMISYSLYTFVFDIPIHFLHVFGILFVGCIIIMLVAGKIKPRETPYVQIDVGAVDLTSWKYAKPISAVVCITIVYAYVVFSPIGIINYENYLPRLGIISLIYAIITIIAWIIVKKVTKVTKF